jgi:alpha-glucoside transport system permease protein
MSMSGSSVELPITTDATPEEKISARKLKRQIRLQEAKTKLSSPWASGIAIALAILWTIPTLGLFITSFRPANDIQSSGWWTVLADPNFTFDNYQEAWAGAGGTGLSEFFLNSFVIVLPGVIIPISLALLAAYAFAWIEFKGRNFLFVLIFALQIVPIQVALIPLQTIFVNFGLQNSFWPVWISHTIFALPLAIFLLHNFMKEVPASIVEAARVDGAGHVKIFFIVLLPLLVPAIAAFGIFQFLWVWNDLLVALVFAPNPNLRPITAAIADLAGTRGSDWQLLSAGAFIAIVVPLIVFLSLQRYFVRGLLAGGVKG